MQEVLNFAAFGMERIWDCVVDYIRGFLHALTLNSACFLLGAARGFGVLPRCPRRRGAWHCSRSTRRAGGQLFLLYKLVSVASDSILRILTGAMTVLLPCVSCTQDVWKVTTLPNGSDVVLRFRETQAALQNRLERPMAKLSIHGGRPCTRESARGCVCVCVQLLFRRM